MIVSEHDNLAADLSILGKRAALSMSARQRVRDRLFKKMGQIDLIDAVQTQTEVDGLVMPLANLLSIFKPTTQVRFSWLATTSVGLAVMLLTFATGALADNATPGSGIFYTVKRAIEETQIALETDPTKKAELQLAIANDRLQSLQTADPETLQAAFEESKKALSDAQGAVHALQSKGALSNDELTNKLATIIGSQKDVLTTIIKDKIGDDSVKQGIVALRDQLDQALNGVAASDTSKIAAKTDEPEVTEPVAPVVTPEISGHVSLFGGMTTAFGQLAINVGGKVYTLVGSPANLSSYIGNSHAQVTGTVTGNQIVVEQFFIDSTLVWETPNKNNNNLPGVEPSQK